MTFILTAVVEESASLPSPLFGVFHLDEVPPAAAGRQAAGYVPGLARHLGRTIHGRAFYVVVDDDGYRSSNALFPYPDDADEPVRLVVPEDWRDFFARLLAELVASSRIGSVVLVAEYNGAVTDPEPDVEWGVDILGPWNRSEFWTHHDRGGIPEESIVLIQEPPPGLPEGL